MLKIDSLTVPSMTLNSASSFIVPTELSSDNSFKIASIGYLNNYMTTIAKLNVNNFLTSFTTTSSIIASPITATTFNLCMNDSNIVCSPLISNLNMCGTLQSWNTTWSKMLNGTGKNKVIKGTVVLSGGMATVAFFLTFSAIPNVIVSTQGNTATSNQVSVVTITTTDFKLQSTNTLATVSYIVFGT
jgi:hypothetical protein